MNKLFLNYIENYIIMKKKYMKNKNLSKIIKF